MIYKYILIKAMTVALTVLSAAIVSTAQDEIFPVYVGYAFKMHSYILDEDRDILVYLPRGLDLYEHKYPVLYITDGDAHFHYASGVVSFLSNADFIPEMIMVAVPSKNRDRDLAPPFEPGYEPASWEYGGQADKFGLFLRDELIPLIDEKYPTLPYRIYSGHSLGGIFGVYSMYTMPELFDAYIISSPPMAWQSDLLIRKSEAYLKANRDIKKFLYLTAGNEGDGVIKPMQRFVQMLVENAPEGLLRKYKYMKDDNHASTPLKSLYEGLELLFEDWNPPMEIQLKGLKAIEEHYRKATEKFGFKVNPPENMLNVMGYRALEKKEYDKAIEIFARNIELYPESANAYDSMGDAYYESGRYELAAKSYEKAIEKAEISKDPNLRIYRINLDRARMKTRQ